MLLKGKELADLIRTEIKTDVENLKNKNIIPTLAIIRLGDEVADISYENMLRKNCENLDIKLDIYKFERDEKTEIIKNKILELNDDHKVGGILIFRPLPKSLDEDLINNTISPEKDIDCMNPLNKAKLYIGETNGFMPLSPLAASFLLDYYGFDLEGKDCLIINKSTVVGKPLTMLLLSKGATVTIAHSKTKNLKEKCKNSDFIFTAMGRAEMLNMEYFTKDSVIIDIGFSRNKNGKLCGDIDFDNVVNKVKSISPVPGGVGPLTNVLLIKQLLKFYK